MTATSRVLVLHLAEPGVLWDVVSFALDGHPHLGGERGHVAGWLGPSWTLRCVFHLSFKASEKKCSQRYLR